MPSRTLFLTRSELQEAVDVDGLSLELMSLLRLYEDGAAAPRRVRTQASSGVTAMVLLPGLAPGIPAYTVKVHAKNPSRQPALVGVICLHDLKTGDLLAVMDSGWLTALRTGLSAAIGTHELAPSDANTVGIIGAGTQGRATLKELMRFRKIRSVHVYDTDVAAAANFVQFVRSGTDSVVVSHSDAASVASNVEILLTATWPRAPVLLMGDVVPGTHITSLGSDEVGKLELDPGLFGEAFVVTDDLSLAEGILPRVDISLGAVLRSGGVVEPRVNPGRTSIYSPVGLPAQDCVVAWHAYQAAVRQGLGIWRDLEA